MGICCLSCGTMAEPDTDFPHQPCTLSDGEPCAPCQEHADLEKEIQATAQRLADLKKKRHPMRSRINSKHPSIVKRFPLEIAAIIFQLAVSDWEDDDDWTSSSLLRSRTNLGQICHDWRDIAWSTPCLWNIISIDVCQYRPSHIKILREWLARSGGLPLSVALHVANGSGNYTWGGEYEKYYPCIDLINDYSHRWRNLKVNLPSRLISRLHAPIPTSSMIETLRIRPTNSAGAKSNATFRLENSRPSPKVVEISNIHFGSLDIDWSNVTTIEVEVVFGDECMEILRHTPQLARCKFGRMIVGDGGIVTSTSVTTLPFLRHLDISHDGNLVMLMLFDRLTVPSLEEYYHDSNDGLFPVESFLSLLERSSCPLKKLQLMDTRCTSNMLELLRGTPTLEKLEILTYEPTETETERLLIHLGATWALSNDERTGNDSLFLPKLRHLSIKGQRSFSWTTLADIFGSKYDSYGSTNMHSMEAIQKVPTEPIIGRPLQSLYIENFPNLHTREDDYVDKNLIPRFVNAARGGVKFSGYWLSSSARHYGMTSEYDFLAYVPSLNDEWNE